MKVRDHKLVGDDNKLVPFEGTNNQGGKLTGNKPRFLVMHYTAGGTASGAISWFKNPSAKASAHLVVDHDGSITQMIHFDRVGWHAGESRWKNVKGVNSHSVGIEVVNWGKLSRSGTGGWVSRTGKPIPAERVVIEAHKHAPDKEVGWEIFDEPQIMASVKAAKAIVAEYGIEPWDLIGHDDVSPIRKVDPGPAFDIDAFRSLVFGRAEDDWDDVLYKVRSSNGLNLRRDSNFDKDPIKLLPNGTVVHVIEKVGTWWLVAEVVNGDDDTTGFVNSHWLQPV